jgi:sec-independent protein translocase protein TatA
MSLLFLLPENPMVWVFIIAVIVLLFGGSKLPQLAKALGQSKRAFHDGIAESEAEEKRKQLNQTAAAPPAELAAVDDEALFEEARRRAAQQRAASGEPTRRS